MRAVEISDLDDYFCNGEEIDTDGKRTGDKVLFPVSKECIRLHEKFNFKLEGNLRRSHFANGEFNDVLCFGITREEFLEKHNKQV